ncbi:MAG: porin [Nitrosomonas sp.]|nr:porin [Nitrosomonas sp.]
MIEELRDQMSDLRKQLNESNARIGTLEQKLQKQNTKREEAIATSMRVDRSNKEEARPVAESNAKDATKIPGTNTSLTFGGFAKLNAIFNSVSVGANKFGDQYLDIASIPVGPSRQGEHDQINFHAKQSRLWFKSHTPSKLGDISTLIELDLFGSQDTYTPRLRHAFGSFGKFLGGQTWTTFANSSAIPERLDFGIPVGGIERRQPQIRWSQPIVDNLVEMQLAFEMPHSKVIKDMDTTIITPGDDRYPDMVLRFNSNQDWGTVSLATLGRQIRISEASGMNQKSWGGAISAAGRINIGTLDNIRFTFNYGNVLSPYVSTGAYADAAIKASGQMELITIHSGLLAYQRHWNDQWRTNIIISHSHADLPAYVNDSLTRKAYSAHINLLWNPRPQILFGLEYLYALRELQNNLNGDLSRFQFSSRFNF